VQLLNDLLDAAAARADAGADRIHILIVRQHCHLGALAGFTRDRADLNNALENLRDLFFKQTLDQHRVRSGNEHLAALGVLIDFRDDDADLLAFDQTLARNLSGLRHQRDGLAEIDQRELVLDRFNDAQHHVVQLVDVFIVDGHLLRLTDLLLHDVSGQRCGSSAESVNAYFMPDHIADLRIRFFLLRIRQRNLQFIVIHFFSDVVALVDMDVAAFLINVHLDIDVVQLRVLLIGLRQRILQSINHDFL